MSTDFDRLTAALAGRYRLEREIGAGGMATVYLAEDLKHHRKVAIKLLHPELGAAVGPDRFLREIEAVAVQLREQLAVYGALVEEADGTGEEGEALDAMCEARVRALFERELLQGRVQTRGRHHWLETDIGLNASGCAYAVKKRRYQAQQSQKR